MGYDGSMLDAPRQNWRLVEKQIRAAPVVDLTPGEKFALYDDMDSIVVAGRYGTEQWRRVEDQAWRSKLERRRREVEAFHKLDQFRYVSSCSHHSG